MNKQKFTEKFMEIIFTISAIISILAVILISLFLFAGAFPAFREIGVFKFLFGENWSPVDIPPEFGILPMILGSLYVTAGAIIIGVPVGIFTAVFLAKVCPKKLYTFFKPGAELLAGIPSVVYGFFGMVAIVPYLGSSMLSASILLGIMILPTIITLSETAIRAVPESYYEGALALGSGHYRAGFGILLPVATSGVFTAIVRGIGRAIGETMAVIMIAGNQPRIPTGIFEGARTLTANIVIEMGYAEGLHRQALIATGVVLFVFILLINFSLSLIKREKK
jgi:phosphate transport system permease protein